MPTGHPRQHATRNIPRRATSRGATCDASMQRVAQVLVSITSIKYELKTLLPDAAEL